MKLYNETKNCIVASKVIISDSFFKRLKGLLGYKNLSKDTAMVIKPCKQVHTWFMRFPIVAIFINNEGKVLHIQPLYPWQMSRYIGAATAVIEIPLSNQSLVDIDDIIKTSAN